MWIGPILELLRPDVAGLRLTILVVPCGWLLDGDRTGQKTEVQIYVGKSGDIPSWNPEGAAIQYTTIGCDWKWLAGLKDTKGVNSRTCLKDVYR